MKKIMAGAILVALLLAGCTERGFGNKECFGAYEQRYQEIVSAIECYEASGEWEQDIKDIADPATGIMNEKDMFLFGYTMGYAGLHGDTSAFDDYLFSEEMIEYTRMIEDAINKNVDEGKCRYFEFWADDDTYEKRGNKEVFLITVVGNPWTGQRKVTIDRKKDVWESVEVERLIDEWVHNADRIPIADIALIKLYAITPVYDGIKDKKELLQGEFGATPYTYADRENMLLQPQLKELFCQGAQETWPRYISFGQYDNEYPSQYAAERNMPFEMRVHYADREEVYRVVIDRVRIEIVEIEEWV